MTTPFAFLAAEWPEMHEAFKALAGEAVFAKALSRGRRSTSRHATGSSRSSWSWRSTAGRPAGRSPRRR
jgi:hypothetical protein